MKKLLIISACILCIINARAQWQTLHFITDPNPLPWLMSIDFINAEIGVAGCNGYISYQPGTPCQNQGSIIKTIDGGLNWSNLLLVDSITFFEIFMFGPDTIVAAGTNYFSGSNKSVFARSINGGLSWDTTMFNFRIYGFSFPNRNVGYISGDNGLLIKTTDCGMNWNFSNLGDMGSCYFYNDTLGLLLGINFNNVPMMNHLYKTTDGGNTWSQSSLTYINPCHLLDVSFISDSIMYLLASGCSYNSIYKSTDGGLQWTLAHTFTFGGFDLNKIFFVNEDTGYVVGQFKVCKTIDGGLTWYQQTPTPPAWSNWMDDIMDVFFINSDTGFIAGSSQFYRTYNGGEIVVGDNSNTNFNENLLNIYPNPASEEVTIEFFKTPDNFFEISIFNINGAKLFYTTTYQKSIHVSLTNYPRGIYFVKVFIDHQTEVKKVIIK